MRRLTYCLATLAFTGCSTTSKQLVQLPALSEAASVQIFYSKPDVQFERICEIKSVANNSVLPLYLNEKDFEVSMQQEARKCGADGVIFESLHHYPNDAALAYATGIKISGPSAAPAQE